MSISLLPQDRETEEQLKNRIQELVGATVLSMERRIGGLNSRVFSVAMSGHPRLWAKVYFSSAHDLRDRLGNEYRAFSFLWQAGLRCICRPVAIDVACGMALYEFIDGESMNSLDVDERDVDDCVEFFRRLQLIKGLPEAENFGPASEACFSLRALEANIRQRCDRLLACESAGSVSEKMLEFLYQDFLPYFEKLIAQARENMDFAQQLSKSFQTLSPSDFGFHNAIRDQQGRTVFVDFEYFGWDDPAKTISDFCLHPAMSLTNELKERFRLGIQKIFADDESLSRRLETVYPLYALKWCMIFLNEFVRQDLARRRFAGPVSVDDKTRQEEQLVKAAAMLKCAQKENLLR